MKVEQVLLNAVKCLEGMPLLNVTINIRNPVTDMNFSQEVLFLYVCVYQDSIPLYFHLKLFYILITTNDLQNCLDMHVSGNYIS